MEEDSMEGGLFGERSIVEQPAHEPDDDRRDRARTQLAGIFEKEDEEEEEDALSVSQVLGRGKGRGLPKPGGKDRGKTAVSGKPKGGLFEVIDEENEEEEPARANAKKRFAEEEEEDERPKMAAKPRENPKKAAGLFESDEEESVLMEPGDIRPSIKKDVIKAREDKKKPAFMDSEGESEVAGKEQDLNESVLSKKSVKRTAAQQNPMVAAAFQALGKAPPRPSNATSVKSEEEESFFLEPKKPTANKGADLFGGESEEEESVILEKRPKAAALPAPAAKKPSFVNPGKDPKKKFDKKNLFSDDEEEEEDETPR